MNDSKNFIILTIENLKPEIYNCKALSKAEAKKIFSEYIKKEKKGVYVDFFILDEKTKLNNDAISQSLANLIFYHLQKKQEKRMQDDSIGSDADG